MACCMLLTAQQVETIALDDLRQSNIIWLRKFAESRANAPAGAFKCVPESYTVSAAGKASES